MATNDDLPDYLTDMNAVLKDVNCKWLNGTPPDYSLNNALYNQGNLRAHLLTNSHCHLRILLI